MGLLQGKKALILGIANERSIAWGITQSLKAQGAQVALSYLNDQLKSRVEPLAAEVGADFIFELDVQNDNHLKAMRDTVEAKWGKFDILVHSLAFTDRNDLRGSFSETSRPGFALAMDVSAYSLIACAQALKGLYNPYSSIIAMTYHGSVKVVDNYNVMGVAKAALEANARYLAQDLGRETIRVNCISAGAIKTLASSAVSGISSMFKLVEEHAPIRENVTTEDVGGTAVYLASDLSKRVTGQVIYVDSGISILAK